MQCTSDTTDFKGAGSLLPPTIHERDKKAYYAINTKHIGSQIRIPICITINTPCSQEWLHDKCTKTC